ncbi:hypothetical protein BGZ70_006473 [Mortierella alpina]|uniref:Uncharacterized protein n=1 Tax=Mortierella alpina TaxID=64518 RepID=A0A9P6M3M5_MORAP|nr:hypothetical protein BGZ70_006473 [Mortierella alpina]
MPPSAKDSGLGQGDGFPAYNPSRRRETPPKLKKPVPHYRHLIRWNDKQPAASLEERQMNHDLVVLRHALDLFLDLRMAESEALLKRGPQPVSANGAEVSDYASLNPTAVKRASQASSDKDSRASVAEDDSKYGSSKVKENDQASLSTEAQEKLSLGSSSGSEKKAKDSKETRSMYYDLGRGIIQGMRAIATFDPDEIAMGMQMFEQTIKTADKQRKGSMMGLGSVKAVGSFVVGTIGAGSFKGMTRVQKHAELVYAEATLLRTGLSVFYHMDLWMVLEEAINLRSAFTIIQGLKSFMDSVESELRAGKNIDHYQIDEHLVSGVTLSYALYNIIISFLPDVIIKMLQFMGFPSDRDWGMAMLAACGDWDPSAAAESPEEHKERLSSSANDGIRRQFCDMVPIIYHTIVSSFIPLKHVDFAFAKRINDYNLELYPDSPFYIYFKGRHLQVTSKLDEAIATYKSLKPVEARWHNFTHISVFEELMCAMMRADHDTACEKSRQLLKESRWSKCCYRYLTAITGLERGKESEKKKINSLMEKVEDGMQKIAGVNLFFETFCARKAKRYVKEGHLLLPSFDFMILWNSFDMMPPKALKRALDIISGEVHRLRELLPNKMKERENRPLAAKDQTIEAATGGYLSGMFSSNKNASAKESKVGSYENFYDDYCLAHFLQGNVAYHLAFFPEEPFDAAMCALALESFETVFRYAPLINDDTYTYYFSHYYKAKIWIHQGRLEEAEGRFKYLLGLTNTSVMSLPTLLGGKGKNSLELFLLLKTHSGQLDLEAAKTAADSGSVYSGK